MKQQRHIRRYRSHIRLVNPNVNKRFSHKRNISTDEDWAKNDELNMDELVSEVGDIYSAMEDHPHLRDFITYVNAPSVSEGKRLIKALKEKKKILLEYDDGMVRWLE